MSGSCSTRPGGTIVIDDDGTGMTRDEVVDRFLRVGFRRRSMLGDKTEKGRRPMGRKGIGKLSTFSVAKIVEVYTERGNERTCFRMDREAIRKKIEGGDDDRYQPDELTDWPDDHLGGTRILLSGLETKLHGDDVRRPTPTGSPSLLHHRTEEWL